MARLPKEGLDYFPLVTDFEDNVDLIMAEFGAAGVGIVVSLWQKIYKNGYFTKWDNDVLMLFARHINEGKTRVNEVIIRSIERGILSKKMLKEHGILTSHGIQKQYLKVCKECRRVKVQMVKDYCLVRDPELLAIITEFISLNAEEKGVNGGINAAETPINHPGSTQSKEKVNKTEKKPNKSTSEKPGSSKNFTDDSLEMRLAFRLKDSILNNNPKAKTPGSLQKWCEAFDKMLRVDKRSLEDIQAVMEFSQQDEFWRVNILSAGKLREKFDQLYLKMQSRGWRPATDGQLPGGMQSIKSWSERRKGGDDDNEP